MKEQDPEHYIKQLELLKELEGKYLLHSEVVIKYQEVIVRHLLNLALEKSLLGDEIDSSKGRFPLEARAQTHDRKHIFLSYSHKDRKWAHRLQTMLHPLVRQGDIHLWTDTYMTPGTNWREAVQLALACAKVAILLVTPNFLASDFIAKHELPPLLENASQEGLTILWIAVSASLYFETEIAIYQAVNNPDLPLDSLRPSALNKELVRVCKCIKRVTS